MRPSIRSGAAWTLLGNVGYSALQYGMLIAIAKLGSPAEVGRFALGLAVSAPIVILTNLNLRAALVTDSSGEYSVGTYVALRLLGILTAVSGIAIAASRSDPNAALVIVLVGVAKGVESFGDVVQGVLQRAERFRRMSVSLLARGGVSVMVVAAVMKATHNLALAVLGLALAWSCILAVIDMPAARQIARLGPTFEWSTIVELARVAVPLGGVACMTSLIPNVPRYSIEAHLGSTALGYFAAMGYLMVAALQPVLALGVAAVPRLATAYTSSLPEFQRLVRRLVAFGIACGVATIVVIVVMGRPLLKYAYSSDYALNSPVLSWLAIATSLSFVTSMLTYGITAARRFKPQLVGSSIALMVCIGATGLLVPRYGLTGAAWALIAAEAARLACFVAILSMVLRQIAADPAAELEVVRIRAERGEAAVG